MRYISERNQQYKGYLGLQSTFSLKQQYIRLSNNLKRQYFENNFQLPRFEYLFYLLLFSFPQQMFPFHFGNGYPNNNYPYPINQDVYRSLYPGNNPFTNIPYQYPNYTPTNQSQFNIYPLLHHSLYLPETLVPPNTQKLVKQKNKKKITKRLPLLDIRKQMRQNNKQYKAIRKTLKYFDPSRAPPITSLRNDIQIQMELKNQFKKFEKFKHFPQIHQKKNQPDIQKLEMMLQQPNAKQYPFLICKKRKYYRNLKRRYSVAYFQQRSSFIINKLPIPAQLHPKNKVRKSRYSTKNENGDDLQNSSNFERQSDQNSSSGYGQESSKIFIKKQQKNEMDAQEKYVVKKQAINRQSSSSDYSKSLF